VNVSQLKLRSKKFDDDNNREKGEKQKKEKKGTKEENVMQLRFSVTTVRT
jgi:hypothetical protein